MPEGLISGARDYGKRTDGSKKGDGYFGALKRPDGAVSTELSVGVNLDGEEREIPLLVPTLTKGEIDHLLSGKAPTKEIIRKSVEHARARLSNKQDPYAGAGERVAPPTED